jgi:hypothetical protein
MTKCNVKGQQQGSLGFRLDYPIGEEACGWWSMTVVMLEILVVMMVVVVGVVGSVGANEQEDGEETRSGPCFGCKISFWR